MTVGFTVGLGFGFGFTVGVPCDCEADDDEPVADDDSGPVDVPGTIELGAVEVDDEVPGWDEADDELAGGADCAEPAFVAGTRSRTAATTRPATITITMTETTMRSRTEPGRGTLIRSP